MPTFTYTLRGRSLLRSTLLLLTIAGAGYVAGGFLDNTGSSRDASAAFAPPVRAAESNLHDALRTTGTAPPTDIGIGQFGGEQIPQPRECDLTNAISTECLWMD